MAELGTLEVAPADAETAIGHLRQIPAGAARDALGGLVPMLWGMALFVILRAGGPGGDVPRVADELRRAASALPAGTAEPGELLAMRAALLAAAAARSGHRALRNRARPDWDRRSRTRSTKRWRGCPSAIPCGPPSSACCSRPWAAR